MNILKEIKTILENEEYETGETLFDKYSETEAKLNVMDAWNSVRGTTDEDVAYRKSLIEPAANEFLEAYGEMLRTDRTLFRWFSEVMEDNNYHTALELILDKLGERNEY